MPATFFYALEAARNYALEPEEIMLWNQKETDTGFLLFAGMARSYISACICPWALLLQIGY